MPRSSARLDKIEESIGDLYKRLYELQSDVRLRHAGEGQNTLYFMLWNRKRPIGKVVDAILDHLKLEAEIECERLVLRKK